MKARRDVYERKMIKEKGKLPYQVRDGSKWTATPAWLKGDKSRPQSPRDKSPRTKSPRKGKGSKGGGKGGRQRSRSSSSKDSKPGKGHSGQKHKACKDEVRKTGSCTYGKEKCRYSHGSDVIKKERKRLRESGNAKIMIARARDEEHEDDEDDSNEDEISQNDLSDPDYGDKEPDTDGDEDWNYDPNEDNGS